ncbi:MAG: cupin domain-containing protein [Acidobacteriota bacterium]
MNKLNLRLLAADMPMAWKSRVLGKVGSAQIKVLRMDALPFGEETHEYNEALFVIDGKMELFIDGAQLTVEEGELIVVEANTPHSVLAGSCGTLMIIDL